jgi:hypothetical protein
LSKANYYECDQNISHELRLFEVRLNASLGHRYD